MLSNLSSVPVPASNYSENSLSRSNSTSSDHDSCENLSALASSGNVAPYLSSSGNVAPYLGSSGNVAPYLPTPSGNLSLSFVHQPILTKLQLRKPLLHPLLLELKLMNLNQFKILTHIITITIIILKTIMIIPMKVKAQDSMLLLSLITL